jgi:hypothetical protein
VFLGGGTGSISAWTFWSGLKDLSFRDAAYEGLSLLVICGKLREFTHLLTQLLTHFHHTILFIFSNIKQSAMDLKSADRSERICGGRFHLLAPHLAGRYKFVRAKALVRRGLFSRRLKRCSSASPAAFFRGFLLRKELPAGRGRRRLRCRRRACRVCPSG